MDIDVWDVLTMHTTDKQEFSFTRIHIPMVHDQSLYKLGILFGNLDLYFEQH